MKTWPRRQLGLALLAVVVVGDAWSAPAAPKVPATATPARPVSKAPTAEESVDLAVEEGRKHLLAGDPAVALLWLQRWLL